MARITKRERLDNMKKELYNSFILALGYGVDEQGYLIDQDTYQTIALDNRLLRYSDLHHHGEIPFDPLMNKRMITTLFANFLERDSLNSGVYYRLYHDEVKNNSKTGEIVSSLYIDTSEGPIRTDYYSNDTLKYFDAIFEITGFIQNKQYLKEYDIPEFRRS